MKLNIISQPEYVSPTAFKVFKRCEFLYYLQYLTGKRTEFTQTPAMAIGSLFDALVKANLAKDLGWYNSNKDLSLPELLKNVNKDMLHLLPEAEKIFIFYKECGAYQDLIKENIEALETSEFVTIKKNQFNSGFPIFGKPDCKIKSGILDWKVNGFGSKSGQSPKQGYIRAYSKGSGYKFHIAHDKYPMPMDEVDLDWATQLTVYSWMYQKTECLEFKEITGAIEQIAIRGDTIKIASFRAKIGVNFQMKLYEDMNSMWQSILNGEIIDPVATKDKCFQFNKKCDFADQCNAFQKAFADNDFNRLMGVNI